jgi:hypothetical protein
VADVLIRDLTPDLIQALDAKAKSLGISRVELLRRSITREVALTPGSVTEEHLSNLALLLPDLGDIEIMRGAWS